MWDLTKIINLIEDCIEESVSLEYKGSGALRKSDGKKKEITKDVSAMANSAGGIIIYGIKEFDDKDKRHLPEKIDGIDRKQFSKEWLEHVINNIRPRLDGVIIYPVVVDEKANEVIYIVEIPQSTTAHQAADFRYYKRFNFESVPMEDYGVKDVIHRLTTPSAEVEFNYRIIRRDEHFHEYALIINIRNEGEQVIDNFKIIFSFPDLFASTRNVIHARANADLTQNDNGEFIISYRSREVLFPQDEIDINDDIAWCYKIDRDSYNRIIIASHKGDEPIIKWTLYADNMLPKHGSIPITALHEY